MRVLRLGLVVERAGWSGGSSNGAWLITVAVTCVAPVDCILLRQPGVS